jgi:hypothetical protein
MDLMTQNLLTERQNLVNRAAGVTTNAAEAPGGARDLDDNERATLANIQSRMRAIDEQLTLTTTDYALNETVAQNLARISGGAVTTPVGGVAWRSAGECVWDYIHQHTDQGSRDRVQAATRAATEAAAKGEVIQLRAAEHMGTTAAQTTPVAGGFGGLIVNPIIGPVIDLAWSGTPLVNALGARPAPGGYQFSRPRIVDPNLNDGAGPQAGGKEKGELPSHKFDVVADQVTMTVAGSYLNLSLQAESFITSPSALDLVISQLNKRTSRGIENAAVGVLETATKTITVAADGDVNAALFEAAAAVFTATSDMPTTLVMGPLGWAKLGGQSDLAGRPLFPWLGANNSNGTIDSDGTISLPFGRTVVTPGIEDDSMYLLNGDGLELYVYRFPMLQAIEPSVLGRQIAVAASLGSYQPPTTEAGPGNVPPAAYEAVVKIDFA